mgnify:CR=1 FL=1
MRLIDADEFIKKFSYAKANTEEENIMCATVRRMVKEQPTACDVEKITSELSGNFRNVKSDEDSAWNRALYKAIEIVKRGGRDEE